MKKADILKIHGGSDMREDIKLILDEFVLKMKECLGEDIQSIVLYGSYARGDFDFQSDVDIMILVQSSEDEIKKFENEVYDCAFDLELKYGKVVSPVIKNQQFFDYWSDTLPFYTNIVKEGVRVA